MILRLSRLDVSSYVDFKSMMLPEQG
jgi:hypothetical protein